METFKKKIIEQYIQTKMTVPAYEQQVMVEKISRICHLQTARKYQEIESEGRAEDGRVWLSIEAMTHSFHYSKTGNCNWVTQIWKKFELILFPRSLIKGEYRNQYVQMLEPGRVLSVSYSDVLALREEYKAIETHIEQISITNELAYQQRLMLLNESSPQQLIRLQEENPLFYAIASQAVKAMHIGLTRQGYGLLEKKMREKKNGNM